MTKGVSRARARFRALVVLWSHARSVKAKARLAGYAAALLLGDRPFIEEHWLDLDGFKFRFAHGQLELNGYFDVWVRRSYEALPDFIAMPGWLVVDIGANVGCYTVLQASRGARVIAIEPNRSAMSRLKLAVSANDLVDRVETLSCAVGETEGLARLRVASPSINAKYEIANADAQGEEIVAVHTLDTLLGAFERVDLVKIDAEGAEASILRGAERSLRNVARIVLEYHSDDLRMSCTDFLLSHNFSLAHAGGTMLYFQRRQAA